MCLLIFLLVVSQADDKEVAAERMAFMKQSATVYAFRGADVGKDTHKIELQANIKRAPGGNSTAEWSCTAIVDSVRKKRPVQKPNSTIGKSRGARKRYSICCCTIYV